MPSRSIMVSVPATSANLGPGFDSFALALELRNIVWAEFIPGSDDTLQFDIAIQGEGADVLPRDRLNAVAQSLVEIWSLLEEPQYGMVRLICKNDIPLNSGLGSSAAARLTGYGIGAALFSEAGVQPSRVLKMTVHAEGHADNAVGAALGRLVVSSYVNEILIYRRVDVPPMKVVIAMPDVKLSTDAMRMALPVSIPLGDAAANIGRSALVLEALRSGDFELLGDCLEDRLHIPYRRDYIPGFGKIVNAAREAGAAGATLSGAGPSIIAFAEGRHDDISLAMQSAFADAGVEARTWVLPVAERGMVFEVD